MPNEPNDQRAPDVCPDSCARKGKTFCLTHGRYPSEPPKALTDLASVRGTNARLGLWNNLK